MSMEELAYSSQGESVVHSASLGGRRSFDFILLGATGFTGKYVAKHMRKVCNGVKWAIAGRSQSKLSELIKELSEIDSTEPLPAVLVVDITDSKSLSPVFESGSILLNCTGPYRFLGESVVEACIDARTHYMDISGEPQFMESCFLKYDKASSDNGVVIIHACAFDSVPADLGVLFVSRQYPNHCCSSIESFLKILAPNGIAGHYTTFECAVHGIGDAANLKKIRNDIESKYKVKCKHVGPKLNRDRGSYFYEDRMAAYAIPFMGADNSVVRSSQRSLAWNKGLDVWPQYAAYATIDTGYNVAATAVYGTIFSTLANFEFGRSILLRCPELFTNGIFSHRGPSELQLASTSFEMHFFARGFSEPPITKPSVCIPAAEVDAPSATNTENVDVAGLGTAAAVPTSGSMPEVEPVIVSGESLDHEGATSSALESPQEQLHHRHQHHQHQHIDPNASSFRVEHTPTMADTCLSSMIASRDAMLSRSNNNQATLMDDDFPPLDLSIHAVVSGAEPGYVATPAIFVALAMCLLEERDRMGSGVFTPSAAFYESPTVFQRLTAAGLQFKVLSKNGVGYVDADAEETIHFN